MTAPSQHRPWRPGVSAALGLIALALAASAGAQHADLDRADWKEDTPPPPPAYDVDNLIDIEISRASTVRVGIDPKSIRINVDTGVVRYVLVARGPSAVNATYEGVRCNTAEWRVYARQVKGGAWTDMGESGWKPMTTHRQGSSSGAQYALRLARDGLCIGPAVRLSAREIERELRTGSELYRGP